MNGPQRRDEWPFVARRAEFEVLAQVVDRGAAHPRVPAGAVVFAPAGVGKTRLVRETLARAQARGIRTASVIATRPGRLTPYAGVAHLAPDAVPEEHADARSWYRAITRSLTRDGTVRPVLSVDDAHLLDPGSAMLVLHLALTASATVIVSVREGEPVPDAITALWKDGLAQRIDLRAFGTDQVGELVGGGLGGPVSHRTIHRLATVSGGNALFVRELVLAAVASGELALQEGMWRWSEQIVLAPALVDAVGRRLSGLGDAGRAAVARIALGEPLSLPHLEHLVPPVLLARLERLGVIRVEDGDDVAVCRLAHPLYGEVVVAQLGALGRRDALRALAEAIEAQPVIRPDDRVRLTRWRLEIGDPVPLTDLVTAARYANRTFDYPLAERLLRAAFAQQILPSAAVALAVALNGQLRFAEAEQILAEHEEALLAEADPTVLQTYLFARTGALYVGLGRSEATRAMYDRLEAEIDTHGAEARRTARCLLAGCRANLLLDEGRLGEVVETTRPILADRPGGLSELLCLETAAEALAARGELERARTLHRRMTELGRSAAPETFRATRSALMQEVLCDSLDGQVAVALPKAVALADRLVSDPDPTSRGLAALIRGAVELQHGTVATARDTLRDALLGLTAPDARAIATWPYALLAQAESLLGHRDEAARAFDQACRGRGNAIARMEPDFVLAAARCEWTGGRHADARRRLVEAAERLTGQPMHRVRLLHAALVLGTPPRTVLPPLRQIAEQVRASLPGVVAEQARALADRDGATLSVIADDYDRRGLWLHAAEAAAQASDVFARTGHFAEAARAAARSRLLAGRCQGARTAALDAITPLAALSPRERQVSQLAAQGLTNAEIADQLVVSVRTVESHLYQAFAKLGIERRAELHAVLGGPRG